MATLVALLRLGTRWLNVLFVLLMYGGGGGQSKRKLQVPIIVYDDVKNEIVNCCVIL